MTIWFISRHPGALHWMQKNEIHYDRHVKHLDPSEVKTGDIVIGSLPINLASEICAVGAEYWNLSLFIPESARGKELSAEELDSYDAKLERFFINRL